MRIDRRIRVIAIWIVLATAVVALPADLRAAEPTVTAIVPGVVDRTSLDLTATYDVAATLVTATGRLRVSTSIDLRNDSGGPIDRVELNLLPLRVGAYHQGDVLVDDRPVAPVRSDQTLIVPLGGILPDGASARIRVGYDAAFSTSTTGTRWMFSRAGGAYAAYRWIPWISRVTPFDRPNFGDPFVTPVSPRVTVHIASDRELGIATSGRRAAGGDALHKEYVAERVRDFTFVAGASYRALLGLHGATEIRAWAPTATVRRALLAEARRALTALEARLGPYPYPTFVVASTPGGWGMESPGAVWIPRATRSSNLRYLVTHETAHQWFYGLVGNDQARQPFADEAAADFVARRVLGLRRASRCAKADLDRSIYGYSSACYYEVVYIQGGNKLDAFGILIGGPAFWSAIRSYLADHRFGMGSTRALLDAIDAATPLDMVPRYQARFPRIY